MKVPCPPLSSSPFLGWFLSKPLNHFLTSVQMSETQIYGNFKWGSKQANNELLYPSGILWNLFCLAKAIFQSEVGNLPRGHICTNGCKRAQRLPFILCNSQRRVIASLTLWPWLFLKWLSKQQQVPGEELSNGFPVVRCPWDAHHLTRSPWWCHTLQSSSEPFVIVTPTSHL